MKLRESKDLVCHTRNLDTFDFNNSAKPDSLGYVSTEVFLSEHERVVSIS